MTANKIPTSPSKDVVYVDLDDEITSIIDKVENAKASVVALVLPKRASVLQSIVNMRLLKRAADKAKKDVVLVTSEAAMSPLAGAAGLHIAKNLQSKPHIPPSPIPITEGPRQSAQLTDETLPITGQAQEEQEDDFDDKDAKIDYDRAIGELAAANSEEPETIPLSEEDISKNNTDDAKAPPKTKIFKDKSLKIPNFDKFRLSLGLSIGGLVLLIIFIILATSVLPKATITLKTTSLPVSANFNLTADTTAKSLDETNNVIPASLQTKDQTSSQTVTASGQQNNGNKASGSVTLSLKDCSKTQITLPAGSGVSTNGLTFITQSSVTLQSVVIGGACSNSSNPGVSSKAVAVTAQTGGSKYNIDPATFSASCADCGSSVSGQSGAKFSGGTDNIATVLSQSDVDGAKQKVTSADSDKFSKDWQKSLSDQGQYVITSTLKLSDPAVTSSVAVGQPATTASVSVKITYTVLSVKNDDLKKVVTDQMNKQIDSKSQKLSSDDILKGLTVSVSAQESPGKASLALSEDTTAVPILDIAGIKKTATGQKKGDIKAALENLPGVQEVSIKLSPFWVSKAPKTSKINVIQQQVSSGNSSP